MRVCVRFEHKLHAMALSPAELAAVAAFLQLNVEEFAPLMRYDLPLKARPFFAVCLACMHSPSMVHIQRRFVAQCVAPCQQRPQSPSLRQCLIRLHCSLQAHGLNTL